MEEFTVARSDQHQTVARLFEPDKTAQATVIIAPAMGVKQQFYRVLAQWLSEQGYRVVTFDYRGTGLSAPESLRGFKTTVTDWAVYDAGGVLAHVQNTYRNVPVFWVGHSLGGQIVGMVPGSNEIDKIITVASGSGYWGHMAPGNRAKSLSLWYGILPIAHALYGYFPGRKLGIIGDIPRGAMSQWRQWCLNPEYLFGVEGETVKADYGLFTCPVTAFAIEDDEMMSLKGISVIHGFFRNAPVNLQRLNSHNTGADHIGHFGFFREKHADSLWHNYLLPELQTARD